MDNLAPVLGVTAFMLVFAWMFRGMLHAARHSRLIKAQAELQSRLLDKLGGSEEMIRYLESGAGRQLLEAPPAERSRPYGRVLASLQAGTILILAGAAFLFLRGQLPDEAEGFVVLGALGLALGVGFLVSGALAFYLSRSWGLIDGRGGEGGS
jgi:hypothetical protein